MTRRGVAKNEESGGAANRLWLFGILTNQLPGTRARSTFRAWAEALDAGAPVQPSPAMSLERFVADKLPALAFRRDGSRLMFMASWGSTFEFSGGVVPEDMVGLWVDDVLRAAGGDDVLPFYERCVDGWSGSIINTFQFRVTRYDFRAAGDGVGLVIFRPISALIDPALPHTGASGAMARAIIAGLGPGEQFNPQTFQEASDALKGKK